MITNPSANKGSKNSGIEVGKSSLDICIYETNRHWQIENTPTEIRKLATRLSRYKLAIIIVEATGGYERTLAIELAERELPIVIVQPMKIRQFANAQGVLAKTDKIDARIIAQFGSVMKPQPRPVPSPEIRHIRDLLARRRQVMKARTQELNRSHKATVPLGGSHTRVIKFPNKEVEWVDTQLDKCVAEIAQWKRTSQILLSAPGIGHGVAYTLLGELPELGQLSKKNQCVGRPSSV